MLHFPDLNEKKKPSYKNTLILRNYFLDWFDLLSANFWQKEAGHIFMILSKLDLKKIDQMR